ncbi:hypothetical protein [Pseudonocardia sp. DLS-67]
MTADYPLMTLPSYELYQLAHIATFLADALARHRRAAQRPEREAATRDIAGGHAAFDEAVGADRATPAGELPRTIDVATYKSAREMVEQGPRQADVVSLAPTGRSEWAIVGHVPGIGPVGGLVPNEPIANALRQHLLTQPVSDLVAWAVTDKPSRVPKLPRQVDLAAFVENLDSQSPRARAVARSLRGLNRRTDAAIRGRFAGIDLDAPLVVAPPDSPSAAPSAAPRATASPAPRRTGHRSAAGAVKKRGRDVVASRHVCGLGPQATSGAANAPTTSAGP